MDDSVKRTVKLSSHNRAVTNEHGLENLVAYYKKMFDRKENLDHYSPDDYQNARRSFVKYSLKNRRTIEGRP